MIRRKPKGKDPVRWIGGVLKKSVVSFLAGTLVLTSLTFMDGDPVETQAASADNMTIIFQRDGKNTVTHNGQAEGTFTYNGINSSGVSYGTLNLDNANYGNSTDMHVSIGKKINLYAPSSDADYTGRIGFRGGYTFSAAGGKGGNITEAWDASVGQSVKDTLGGYGSKIISSVYDYDSGASITYRKGSNGYDIAPGNNNPYWNTSSNINDIVVENKQFNSGFYAQEANKYRSFMFVAPVGTASYIQVSGNTYLVAGGGGSASVAFHQKYDPDSKTTKKWVTKQIGQNADQSPSLPSGKSFFNPASSAMTLRYHDYVSPNVNATRFQGVNVKQGVQDTYGKWHDQDIVTGWLADTGTLNNPVILERTYPGYSGKATRNGRVFTPISNRYDALASIATDYNANPYVQLKCNYKIVVINNPTRPGFNFTGWTNLKNCQLLANSNGQSTFKVTGTDSSIEATWSSNSYTLTINPNGGIYNGTTANTVKTLPAETNYEVTEIPTRTGYDFVGWKRSGSGSLHSGTAEAVNSMIKVAEKADSDGTAYTNYSMNVTNTGTDTWWPGFTAFHYPYTAGHTYIMSYDVRVNNSSGLVYSQIRNSGFDNNYDFNYATGNLGDVTNGWEHRTIERTFQSTTSQNGSAVTTNPVVEFYCGVAVGKTGAFSFDLKNITIYDATAKKYVTSESATVKSGSTLTMDSGNTTLTAVWKAKEYKLTLNPNSGKFDDGTTKAKTLSPNLLYGVGNWWDISSMSASRNGYTLEGWYDKASGGEKVYQADGSCVDGTYWKHKKYQYEGDLTVYAHWTTNKITLRYNMNGGTLKTTPYENTGFTNPYIKLDSSDYVTWSATADGTYSYATKMVNYNMTSIDVVNVGSFGGTKTGYHIDGTKAYRIGSKTGTTISQAATTDTTALNAIRDKAASRNATVDLYANWIANTYTVNYDGNGATSGSTASSSHTYDVAKKLTKNGYERTDYHFIGWNTKANGKGDSFEDMQSVKNLTTKDGDVITLYAQWKRNTCNVKIIKGDHVASATGNGDYAPGEEVTISAKADNGYEIVGWEGTYNTTDNPYKFPMPEQDVEETVTAQPIQYQIRYDYNGGTADPENPSDYNIETPDFTLNNPTKEGYEFEGWTGSNGDTPQETVTIPKGSTGDLNYIANWKPIQYVIHFDGNGATSGSTPDVTGTYDEDVTIPENGFERETDTGKSKFLGWSTDPNSTDPEYKPGDVVKNRTNVKDEVITVYAIWDDCPNIEAHDLYYTLTQAQNGDITESELLSYAKATDREDGEISPGADLEKGTAFTVWDYQAEDFLNFQHEGSVTETYQVIDSQGNIFQKQITVYVVDTTPKEVANAGTTRFINKKYFNKTALNGGLADDSLWRTDAEYNSILRSALENLENDTSEKTYHFTHEDILNMKQFIKDNGVGNSRSADALTRFYDTFMN